MEKMSHLAVSTMHCDVTNNIYSTAAPSPTLHCRAGKISYYATRSVITGQSLFATLTLRIFARLAMQ